MEKIKEPSKAKLKKSISGDVVAIPHKVKIEVIDLWNGLTDVESKGSLPRNILSPTSPEVYFRSAKKGIDPKAFFELSNVIKWTVKDLGETLNISPKTIKNYIEERKALKPETGEHILMLIDLYLVGQDLFGTVENFNKWLDQPSWKGIGAPRTWLDTNSGIEMAKDELYRMMEGGPL